MSLKFLGGRMDRDGPTTTQAAAAGVVSLGAAIEATAGALTEMRPLRREARRLLERYDTGSADAGDLHDYRMARLRLLMLQSANRGVRHPLRATEVLGDRERLRFHAMVDRTDPFPEPQPS